MRSIMAAHNNGLEAINGTIKKESKLRELLNIQTWLVESGKLVKSWSRKIDPSNINHKEFADLPEVERQD
jgi:hypothetical protein